MPNGTLVYPFGLIKASGFYIPVTDVAGKNAWMKVPSDWIAEGDPHLVVVEDRQTYDQRMYWFNA